MLIPLDWSRPRKQIATAYYRHIGTLRPHQSIIKIIGAELEYERDPYTGSYPFVALVIRELTRRPDLAGNAAGETQAVHS